jgi:hypothetical protein
MVKKNTSKRHVHLGEIPSQFTIQKAFDKNLASILNFSEMIRATGQKKDFLMTATRKLQS